MKITIAYLDEIEVTYSRQGENIEADFMQFASISLIINNFMEQIGNDFRTQYSNNIADAVNYSIKQI